MLRIGFLCPASGHVDFIGPYFVPSQGNLRQIRHGLRHIEAPEGKVTVLLPEQGPAICDDNGLFTGIDAICFAREWETESAAVN